MFSKVKEEFQKSIREVENMNIEMANDLVVDLKMFAEKELKQVESIPAWVGYIMKNKEKIQNIDKKIMQLQKLTGNKEVCDNMRWLMTEHAVHFYNDD